MKEKRIFFISGHRDITPLEFQTLYVPKILEAIDNYDAYFIIGDYEGVDIIAQNFLIDIIDYDRDKITVYHMFDSPRNVNAEIMHTQGGYNTDEDRDYAMSQESDEDIAFIRCGRFKSGTAQNILRRCSFYSNETKVEKYLK